VTTERTSLIVVARELRRDPDHLPERLVLYAHGQLASETEQWLASAAPTEDRHAVATNLCASAAGRARVNGAIAGTPFLLALVPAYVTVLWDEVRLVLRVAALNGHDPSDPKLSAQILWLRGLYPTPDAAAEALGGLGTVPQDGLPHRGPRGWVRLAHRVLILAGFLSAPDPDEPEQGRLHRVASGTVSVFVFWFTWVVPITFMVAMAWSCEQDVRRLGHRATEHYGGVVPSARSLDRESHERGLRRAVHAGLLALSLIVPIAIIAGAVLLRPLHSRLLSGVASLVGLAVVVALAGVARNSSSSSWAAVPPRGRVEERRGDQDP
jgi:hypothetical protein